MEIIGTSSAFQMNPACCCISYQLIQVEDLISNDQQFMAQWIVNTIKLLIKSKQHESAHQHVWRIYRSAADLPILIQVSAINIRNIPQLSLPKTQGTTDLLRSARKYRSRKADDHSFYKLKLDKIGVSSGIVLFRRNHLSTAVLKDRPMRPPRSAWNLWQPQHRPTPKREVENVNASSSQMKGC